MPKAETAELKPMRPPASPDPHPDQERFKALKEAGFSGSRFEYFRGEMWERGLNVLHSWMKKGTIGAECGIELRVSELDALNRSRELRDQLAVDTLIEVDWWFEADFGLRHWNPYRGAGLATFYIGACKGAFRNRVRAWRRSLIQEQRVSIALLKQMELDLSTSAHEAVLLRSVLRQVLAVAELTQKAICWHIYNEDLTFKEIGQKLGGKTARSIEGHMRRLRVTVREEIQAGRLEVPVRYLTPDGAHPASQGGGR